MPRLIDRAPALERLLNRGDLPPPRFRVQDIRCEFVGVRMRDGVTLATDLYLPPVRPAPVVAMLTPYGRDMDWIVGTFFSLARRGYVVVSQDCRGTGASEPDEWDYYMYDAEDGYDLIEWISHQEWSAGFIGSCGGSYVGQTQWCMATHPSISATVPQVSGLGLAINTARLHMFVNAYAYSVGKGQEKVNVSIYDMERTFERETLASGFFNEPLYRPLSDAVSSRFPSLQLLSPAAARQWLWEYYAALPGVDRVAFVKDALGIKNVTSKDVESLSGVFGHRISHDRHTLPDAVPAHLCQRICAPPLLLTGWYDWGLNDALETWVQLRREGLPSVAASSRLVIGPHAHNMPGYHEGIETHPELIRVPSVASFVGLILRWYETVRGSGVESWPPVIYYLMGANEWRVAEDWPVPEARQQVVYLAGEGALTDGPPKASPPDRYVYDPTNPTPTVGGSIVSFLYPPGSVDVSDAQKRPDVLVYTSAELEKELDVVGPLKVILYASSSAVDTDFVVRLSDVFPDGRAVQIQNGILRARYRNPSGEPELLKPHFIYRFEIDMWATANRFMSGHRLRVDVSSADFPRYDRNSNLGGALGRPAPAQQTIYHDPAHPSHLIFFALP